MEKNFIRLPSHLFLGLFGYSSNSVLAATGVNSKLAKFADGLLKPGHYYKYFISKPMLTANVTVIS